MYLFFKLKLLIFVSWCFTAALDQLPTIQKTHTETYKNYHTGKTIDSPKSNEMSKVTLLAE